jgi:hypothetical protein
MKHLATAAVAAASLLGMSVSMASAAPLFTDSFTGFDLVNLPPTGWSDFSTNGAGVDGAQSGGFWPDSGNLVGPSPEGDADYVRAFTISFEAEGLSVQISGFDIGQQYEISFYSASSNAFDGGPTSWDVFLDGIVIGSSAVGSVSTLLWDTNSIYFTASSGVQTIGFRAK